MATLAKLFQLPGLPCGDSCDYEVQLAQDMAQSFLDRFARQNTSEEIEPVPLKEQLVVIDQSAEERAIYMQASHDLCEANGGPLEITGESRGVDKLIKLCSHFAAYLGMASGAPADAGTECRRILSTKEQQAKRTANQLLRCSVRLELRLQQASRAVADTPPQELRWLTYKDVLRRLGAQVSAAPNDQLHSASGITGGGSATDVTSALRVVTAVTQPAAAATGLQNSVQPPGCKDVGWEPSKNVLLFLQAPVRGKTPIACKHRLRQTCFACRFG